MPSTRKSRGDRWPPLYTLDLSPAQSRALELAYIELVGGPCGGSMDRRTIRSLVDQGLMLPSGALTRRGVDAHVRTSGKSGPQKALARARADQAEREEAACAATLKRLHDAGCLPRGGLFLIPEMPVGVHETVRSIRLELERRTAEGRAEHVEMLSSALAEIERSRSSS